MLSPRLRYLAVLLCVVVLSGCRDHQGSAARGLVPWTDERVETAELARSATSPTCRVQALDLPRDEQRWGGVWNNAVAGYFMIENAGGRTCDLPTPSRVTARAQSGTPIAFDVGRLAAPAIVLDPGDRLQVQVSSPYDCGKPLVRSVGFDFTFPTGTLTIPRARMAVQCGGAVVDFSARDGGSPGAATTTTPPASRLEARISDVPDTISADHSVSYSVTLTNPTSTAITLAQCPAYQEGIKGRPSTVQSYRLNCGAVSRIGAHASVNFAMQLPLPPRLAPGEVVLDWRLLAPQHALDDGQFASADTRVR